MTRRAGVLCALLLGGCATTAERLTVAAPLVDLRAEPATAVIAGTHDLLQETQLLYGEQVRVRERRSGWARVEAVEQPEFTHARKWQGYPGWVPAESLRYRDELDAPTIVVTEPWAVLWKDLHRSARLPWQVPLGTRLTAVNMGETLWKVELLDGETAWLDYRHAASLAALAALPTDQVRARIVEHAARLRGVPYLWGGRSPAPPTATAQATGVDCSALVNLAYRAAGVDIPRDAHEQFLRAKPIARPEPADLIFLSADNDPRKIVHVLLYAGDGMVLEAPGTGLEVRRIAAAERLSRAWETVEPGTVVNGQTVTFGSYLSRR